MTYLVPCDLKLEFYHETDSGEYGSTFVGNALQYIILPVIGSLEAAVRILGSYNVILSLALKIIQILNIDIQHQTPFVEKRNSYRL
jgi:hypothetical protein